MTSISFILPYYRLGRKLLDRAVDSILNARLACDYEIIVVDDGTPDRRLRSGLMARAAVCATCGRRMAGSAPRATKE